MVERMTDDVTADVPELDLPELMALPPSEALWQSTLGWQPSLEQQALFQRLYVEIVTVNRQLNLTRITEASDFWEKHLWDSLRGIQSFLNQDDTTPKSLIDIGTGAGFPGLPIAIVFPDWQLTLVDSTRKKINFVQQTATSLGLSGVTGLSDRIELLGQNPQYRQQYDIATVRAVAAVSVCAEYALPMVKVGGQVILYRGQWSEEEATHLQTVIGQLGGTIDRVETFETPLTQGTRTCVYLRKNQVTNNWFPRAIGVPTMEPL
jgi:16S rRNA (guanine527-N7)-methyltransferase